MTLPPSRLALAVLPLLVACQVLVACQAAPQPRTRANAATQNECRAVVDRVYAAQNRSELSTRDERDSPFAASYNSGIVTRGLSGRFQRDNMVNTCLDAAGNPSAVDVTPAPTFAPRGR